MMNRGSIHKQSHSSGKYEQAISLFQRSITIQEKSLGPDNPKLASTLENYANLLRKTGRETEAATLEARAQTLRSKQE
jgi:tetratricopeptide (TPR) repeat protein